MHGRVFLANSLEDPVLIVIERRFQRVPAQDIHIVPSGELVPEVLEPKRCGPLAFSPQTRCALSASRYAGMLSF